MRLDQIPKVHYYVGCRPVGYPPGSETFHLEECSTIERGHNENLIKELTAGQLNWLAGRWHGRGLTSLQRRTQ